MEDGRPRLSSTIALARALSLLGHPFLLIPLTIAALTGSFFWTAVIAASTTVPLLLIIARKVRRGAWSDFDVSRHEQRSGLYYAGIPLMALSALLLYLLGASASMLRGVAAGGVMFLAGLLGNRFLKISMHMMFASFCTVALTREYPSSIYATLPFLAAIAWSRRYLDRHTWAEIAVGVAIGAACGLAG
ncbi:MAG: hypothetical protein QOJ98_1863 [Acidobacteriota bacterium]|jgi:hypothetical protein|nr:hypothetical protein [Acidobacteriota bacterium]